MKKFLLVILLIVGLLTTISSFAVISSDTGGFVFMLIVGVVFIYFAAKGIWRNNEPYEILRFAPCYERTNARKTGEMRKHEAFLY